MSTKNKYEKRLVWVRQVFIFILLTFSCAMALAQDQLIQIHGVNYALEGGKWYMYDDNRFGSEICLKRVVVRKMDRGSITENDLALLGIATVRFASSRFVDGYYVLSPADETKAFEMAQTLSQSGHFEHVIFDAYGKRSATSNDQYFGQQWNLDQTKLRMASAWDISSGNSSTIVGIIDSGCDYDHPDLTGNMWSGIGWDFVDNDNTPIDILGHGTAVTGILGARSNNSIGVAGIAGGWSTTKGVSLMILKDSDSEETLASITAQGVEWATDHGAHVLNISTTWLSDDIGVPDLRDAINDAVNNHNVVIVAAAGNSGTYPEPQVQFPASMANVVAVGATNQNDVRISYSSYGETLDVVAPSHVYTTDIRGTGGYVSGDYNSTFTGTSASAPHVAGLAGLIRSVNSSLTWTQVHDIIYNTADKVPAMGGQSWTEEYGWGRLNAYQAALLSTRFHNYDDVFLLGILYAKAYLWAYIPFTFWSMYAKRKPLFSSSFRERTD